MNRLTPILTALMTIGIFGCDVPAGDPATDRGYGQGPGVPAPSPADQPRAEQVEVQVFFTVDEEPRPVTRRVPETRGVLRAALEELLRGPRPDEQAAGYTSFFSPETEGMLQDVHIDEEGRAVVDFEDFSRIIPNASTSAGSAMLVGELNSTVFQFPEVRSVEYRFEGSCSAFWNWLQSGCGVVERP